MKLNKLLVIILFSLPHWNKKYWPENKMPYFEKLPRWMRWAIKLRNETFTTDSWVWFKLGRLYIRDNYAYPDTSIFKYSKNHLFVWEKRR